MSKHELVRKMARENSNSVTLARQELDSVLREFNKLNIKAKVVNIETNIGDIHL